MKIREWLAISLVMGFLVMNLITAKFTRYETKKILQESKCKKNLSIEIIGAIEKEGIYECPFGAKVGELLKNVKLLPQADRQKIPFKKTLLSNQKLEIPKKNGQPSLRKKISLEEK